MVVIVCGDRFWTDVEMIEAELRKLPKGTIIVHGACRGADTIASNIAKRLGFEVRPYPADWDEFGVRAGPFRNRKMLRQESPNLVIAFHKDLANSKGTKDMVEIAKAAQVPVKIIPQPASLFDVSEED
jgi:hypothetical protein